MSLMESLNEERRSAYLYSVLARHEKNILHKKLFTDLQTAANKQARLWETKIKESGIPLLPYRPDLRTKIVERLIALFGADAMHRILSGMKIRGMSIFTRYHSEHKHTSINASSNLRAAIFGLNDGLISNMSLILGIAAAETNPHFIILAGIAGLLAGACSMGAGECVSVRSQRDIFEHQIEIEKQELAEYPEEEIEELSLIYQARQVPKEDAEKLARLMVQNPDTGLNTLAREELGLNPEDLVSPYGAMIASFLSFALGAFIPLLPFVLIDSVYNLGISMALTALTLFVTGGLLSLFTNRHPILQGGRMLMIGAAAGLITYFIGKWVGVVG